MFEAYYNLGEIAYIENEYDDAEKYYKKASFSKKLDSDSFYNLAKIYMLKKDYSSAIGELDRAVKRDEKYKEKAKEEPLFDGIRDTTEFGIIVA